MMLKRKDGEIQDRAAEVARLEGEVAVRNQRDGANPV